MCIAFESNWKTILDRFRLTEDDLVFSENQILSAAKQQLEEYFFAGRRHFSLPLELNGTSFQRAAWTALLQIPYGKTTSYSAQARAAGRPSACRAVGNANRLNPLCIVVPCHRVIGQNGNISGYAGGSEAKKTLLKIEISSPN
jgi:methylated-DNA-[protein]-cysteine S-methyltransferase